MVGAGPGLGILVSVSIEGLNVLFLIFPSRIPLLGMGVYL